MFNEFLSWTTKKQHPFKSLKRGQFRVGGGGPVKWGYDRKSVHCDAFNNGLLSFCWRSIIPEVEVISQNFFSEM